ncbi:MAG: CcmD family protein [Bacteroidales bacterium]
MEIKDIDIVVIVLLVIFAGIVFYLFSLDRRISKIEKNLKLKEKKDK